MRRDEYLRELSIALEGRIAEEEARAAVNECEAAFAEGFKAGKTEEEVSSELGSPAKRGRRILEMWQGNTEKRPEEAEAYRYGPRQGGGYGDHMGQSTNSSPQPGGDAWSEGGPQPGSGARSEGGPQPGSGARSEGGPQPGGDARSEGGSPPGSGFYPNGGPSPDSGACPGGGFGSGSGNPGERQYTDFQKKVNRAAADISGRVGRVNPEVAGRDLASMGTRLGAFVLDWLLSFFIVLILTIFFAFVMRAVGGYGFEPDWIGGLSDVHHYRLLAYSLGKEFMYNAFPTMFSGVYWIAAMGLGGIATMSTLCVWLTNGYTPGKWILRIRIVKLSGEKISFLDALFREALVKGAANGLLKGLLNAGSFIWGCATEDRKTVQDLAAQTTVVRVTRW